MSADRIQENITAIVEHHTGMGLAGRERDDGSPDLDIAHARG